MFSPHEDRPPEEADTMAEVTQEEARDMTMEGLSQSPNQNTNVEVAEKQAVEIQGEKGVDQIQAAESSEPGTRSASVMETAPAPESVEIPQIELANHDQSRLTPIPECTVKEEARDLNMNVL